MKKILSLFLMMVLLGIIYAQTIPQVVISGVYGGGGNSGAPFKNDYVELYNTTSSNISIAGYTLYYSPAAGGTNQSVTKNNTFTFPAGAVIEANGFVLVKAAAGTGSQPDWPINFDFDASGDSGTNFAMAAAAGRVLLLDTYVDLTPANSHPTTLAGIQAMAHYVDFMPYGKAAVPVFGSSTADLSASKAASRKYNGSAITYTFNVGTDFNVVTVNENTPRNSDFGATNRVATPIFSPAGGTFNEPVSVTITCSTIGATIRYTLDGSEPTLSSTIYSSTLTVDKQTTINAKAWKEGMDPSKVATATFNYPQPVSTIAALRALAPAFNEGTNTGTAVHKFIGQAVVTQKQDYNNVKYIQDGTGAIMIFDPNGKLKTDDIAIGDKITNISGTLTNYFGMLEFIPVEEEFTSVSWGNQVSVTKITASQLNFAHNNPIQAKVVVIKDVLYAHTGDFVKGAYYNIKENNIVYDSVVYIEKYEADYVGKPIPTILVNIKGVINFKGGKDFPTRNRIVPLDNSNNVAKISDINPSIIKLSPNPANSYVNIVADSPMKLEVYSLLGNQIYSESLSEGSNTISVSNYPAGVYLMKFIDKSNGQSFIQKLVIR